ncbi:MAG: bifunctional adenosylcobinamide kinase/adenosylcobinamide-phosphate guanylyltransferase, partial [Candidatus Melainabacteria bacterium]|nr:bifunctional adenosylcobinamide kinase/adenosylcobinamide-phosphate guanylyltransferase [Candidatus Melainabacteria bacterium]
MRPTFNFLNDNTNLVLITGGARSGKSALAEALARDFGHKIYYLATMQQWSSDGEVDDRVRRHRARRPQDWHTLEVPFSLDEALRKLPAGPGLAILDCISVY